MTSWKWRIEIEGLDDDIASLIMSGQKKFTLPPRVLPGARSLTIKLIDDEGRRPNKQVKLRWYQPIIYSVKGLVKDARIDISSLRSRIETVGMTSAPVSAVDQLKGATLRKTVSPGASIMLGDVEDALIVRSGSSVKLVAMANGLGVEVLGVALQRGGMGDVIKVKNLSSRKVMSGTVIDVGRVAINN
jgi:flagella basal body P-ring formation protein FlgA